MPQAAPIRHLSPTKVEAGIKCGELLRFRYEEKVPEPSVGHLLAGRVVHKVIERALKALQSGGKLPEWQELDDWFPVEWEAHVRDEEEKPAFLGWKWDEGDPEEKVREQSRALVPFARSEILPSIRPNLVEHKTKRQFQSDAGPFLVWGVIDLLEEDGRLSDWKTTRGEVSRNAKASWLQLACYSHDVAEMTGQEVTPARKIFLVRGERPDMEVARYEIGPGHREWFRRQAAAVWRMAQARTFTLAMEGSWYCSEKFCSFWSMCKGALGI